MTLNSPEVKKLIADCEREVRELTGNDAILLTTFVFPNERCTWDEILRACEIGSSIPREEILGRSRKEPVVIARQLLTFFAMTYAGMSSTRVAMKLDQDHTTVLHNAIEIKEKMVSCDDKVTRVFTRINEILFPTSNHRFYGQ